MSILHALQREFQLLRDENCCLKASSGCVLNEESLKNDDAKVKFYTGLTFFKTLMALIMYISAHVVSGPRSTITRFQQFLMVLIKLRLNLPNQDIAYRFGVHQSSVSRNFRKWIDVMYSVRFRQVREGVIWEVLCTTPLGGSGGMPPQENFEILTLSG